jgi:hypothetical protein
VGRKEVQGNDIVEKGRLKKIKSIKMNRLGLIGDQTEVLSSKGKEIRLKGEMVTHT